MSIQPSDVTKVVAEEDDFGHEMRVGRIMDTVTSGDAFNRTSVDIPDHGGTYTDSVTGKPRQFDYRCRVFADPAHREGHGKCALLAIECKNLHKSAPLVVCGRERLEKEAYHTFVRSSYANGHLFRPIVRKAEGQLSMFKPYEFVGKSWLRLKHTNGQLKTDTQSDFYDRWAQALASSIELAEAASEMAQTHKCETYSAIVMPIVVVPDDTLWTLQYDNGGTISKDPGPVEQCDYFIERKIPLRSVAPLVLTHIHFVTLKGFSELLTDFVKNRRKWDRLFPSGSVDMQ